MELSTGVFERSGSDSMSERLFYTLLGFFIIWGLATTAFVAHHVIEIGYKPSPIGAIVLGFVFPICGIYIALKSDNWLVSFIAYNMITVPFGVVLAPAVQGYSPSIIRNVCMQTAIITGFMGFAGMSFPSVFRHLGGFLFVSLLGLLGILIAQMFVPAWQGAGWVHWVAVVIFTLYIGYDFHRASEVPRTVDSAVDIAVSIYLDILNVFLHLLKTKD